MRNRTWMSAHLFYYDPLTRLLTGCVQPIVEECRAAACIEGFFFLRYWQGGPHIRLRLLPGRDEDEQAIREIIERQSQAFFVRSPSVTALDSTAYAALSERLSHMEYGADHRLPLQPADCVRYLPYQAEDAQYGGVQAMPAVERAFGRGSDIALELCTRLPTRKQLSGQAVAMGVLALALCVENSSQLAALCEGHLQGWYALPPELREPLYARLAQHYQQRRSQLKQLIAPLLAIAWQRSSTALPAHLRTWLETMRELLATLRQLEQRGQLHTPLNHAGTSNSVATIILRCVHMQNNRLGMLMADELSIFFMIQQTAQDLAYAEAVERAGGRI